MVRKINNFFRKHTIKRSTILFAVFLIMTGILLSKIYTLQIIHGEEYANDFSIITTKERSIKSTRGNIYDRNGNLLAYNELTYAVTLEDNGSYKSTRIKNLMLNSEIYRLIKMIESKGDTVDSNFHIVLNEQDQYEYDVSGTSLLRFLADVFGYSKIDQLSDKERETTAEELMELMVTSRKYFLIQPNGTGETDKPFTEEEQEQYDYPRELSKKEILQIVTIRYQLHTTSFRRYLPITVASDVSDETVALLMEHQSELQGVDIVEDYKRVYNDSVYFASLLGYTGKASTEELEQLRKQSDNYSSSSIIGKTGIEQIMETSLQGIDGSETVLVDNLGKVLEIKEESTVQPKQGNDVYLTIDKDLQIAVYKILEQRIAGIVLANLRDIKEYDASGTTDTSSIPIAAYDVYFALINNNIIDYRQFGEDTSSDNEKSIYDKFVSRQEKVLEKFNRQLTGSENTVYKDLSDADKAYQSYVVNEMLMSDTGILDTSLINTEDETYKAWKSDETVSIHDFLRYCATMNWIDVSKIAGDKSYLSTEEILDALWLYIEDYLKSDSGFSKLIYKYMLLQDEITPEQICRVLYDQEVLKMDQDTYNKLANGSLSAYEFIRDKIEKIEITPAQLALDPCSGSAVVTDPNSGEFLAVVSYPGYDNNRLANTMDSKYYNQLLNDLSQPFYNKATQQKTAPGSTFKPVTAVAGLTEGVITTESEIDCTGVFDKIQGSPLKCWNTHGHGPLKIVEAIAESCNVFFSETAYEMGINDNQIFSEDLAMTTLQKYCKLFNLDKNSGIEISESNPQISDSMPIPSAIGQGTHNYTTTQLARYVSTIANNGISFNMTLLDKVTDSQGNLIQDYSADVESVLEVSDSVWDTIHTGMREVITNKKDFDDLGVELAGKTGTAQENRKRSSHGLFIGYAPYNNPEIAICVRIPHGYSSTNAALTAKDILNYHFNLVDEEKIITGKAKSASTNVRQD